MTTPKKPSPPPFDPDEYIEVLGARAPDLAEALADETSEPAPRRLQMPPGGRDDLDHWRAAPEPDPGTVRLRRTRH